MGGRRTFLHEVVQHSVADRTRQRQHAPPARLGRKDRDSVVLPADVPQAQGPDLAPAQPVGGNEEEHGVVAPGSSAILDDAQQGLHLVPRQGARNIGEAISPSQRHRTDQVRSPITLQVEPAEEPRERCRQVVPRRAPKRRPTIAAESEHVVGAQGRQILRVHGAAAADQEVAQVASVIDDRRLSEPPIAA